MSKSFFNFLFILIYQHRSKHIAIFIISFMIVFLLSSVMFISSSIKHQLFVFSNAQPDFVVQKLQSGQRTDIPNQWINDFQDIRGISHIQSRVYGRYYHLGSEYYFTIVGVDVFDEFTTNEIQNIFDGIDIEKFISGDYMLIGAGVKEFFDKNYYSEYYNFLTPQLEIKKVDIFDILPEKSGLISNDMIIMDINLARDILGVEYDNSTDIILNIPNDTEWQNIKMKLLDKHHNIQIITKEDLQKSYINLYNYKSGFFLILFIILLLTFCLVLYQRYSMINSSDKKEIAILRFCGWSIKSVVMLKVFESSVVGILSFLSALSIAYCYVFIFGAPILRDIFLGSQNISNNISFVPFVEFSLILSIFLFFITFFIASVLIPSWKIATKDIDGSLR
ncbi:FtsX-like permease family protein [Arcobacter sp. FWKO B]|uniref:FtsX-like permease family protein n=1 Tax=Arcobacter sp. FWKO B TaxID=2593672 RepID=UPI0019079D83|nr:FtsX-like permease family protein [Arcobacter sp. FWKO B]